MSGIPDYTRDANAISIELRSLRDTMHSLEMTVRENTHEHKRAQDGLAERVRTLEINDANMKGKFAVWASLVLMIGVPAMNWVIRMLSSGN